MAIAQGEAEGIKVVPSRPSALLTAAVHWCRGERAHPRHWRGGRECDEAPRTGVQGLWQGCRHIPHPGLPAQGAPPDRAARASPLQIAAEISAPLSRTQEIVLISGKTSSGGLTSDLSHLAGSLQPAIQTLTGVNIASVRAWCSHACTHLRGRRCRRSRAAPRRSGMIWQTGLFVRGSDKHALRRAALSGGPGRIFAAARH